MTATAPNIVVIMANQHRADFLGYGRHRGADAEPRQLPLIGPGGQLVAVDGFWFAGSNEGEVPPLFAQHYTPATKDALPFMHLDRPDPIVEMLCSVGFVNVTAEPRPELALDSGVPYFFLATRP